MISQNSQLDFSDQHFFIGIDVHLRNWTVTIRHQQMELKTQKMNPSPKELSAYMKHHYPHGIYHSVYEAGFCGFWIHRELSVFGFKNIVVNAADVPSSHKEKVNKRDSIDSRKLSRELENYSLSAIYVPDEYHEQFRSLVRLRKRTVSKQTRVKNQIKSHLYLHGLQPPPQSELAHWSGEFIHWLTQLNFAHQPGKDTLLVLIKQLQHIRQSIVDITRLLRQHTKANPEVNTIINSLMSIPGIGFITAITLYSELIDIHRFPKLDHLCAYTGIIPSIQSSDETEKQSGITQRKNAHLRHVIVEAAWVAIRKDPAMTLAFNELTKRMKKQDAIIRIAKKLLNRVRYTWINQTTYQKGVIM